MCPVYRSRIQQVKTKRVSDLSRDRPFAGRDRAVNGDYGRQHVSFDLATNSTAFRTIVHLTRARLAKSKQVDYKRKSHRAPIKWGFHEKAVGVKRGSASPDSRDALRDQASPTQFFLNRDPRALRLTGSASTVRAIEELTRIPRFPFLLKRSTPNATTQPAAFGFALYSRGEQKATPSNR